MRDGDRQRAEEGNKYMGPCGLRGRERSWVSAIRKYRDR